MAPEALTLILVRPSYGDSTLKDGRIVFEPADEGVVLSFDTDGFTATATGQLRFVDHWKKLR